MAILLRIASVALLLTPLSSLAAPSPRAVSDVSADLATAVNQTIQIARDQLSDSPPSAQQAVSAIKALTASFNKAQDDGKGTTFKKADRASAAAQVEDLSNAIGAACEGFTKNVQAYAASKDDINSAYQDLYESFEFLNDVINPPNKKKDYVVKDAFLDWYQGFSRCQLAFDPPPCYGDVQPDGTCGGYGVYSDADGSEEDSGTIPSAAVPAPPKGTGVQAVTLSATSTSSSASSTASSTQRATQSPQTDDSPDNTGYGIYIDPSEDAKDQDGSPEDTGYGIYTAERGLSVERHGLADFTVGGISKRADGADGYAAARGTVNAAKAAFEAITQVAKGTNDTTLIIPKINATRDAFKDGSAEFQTSFAAYTAEQAGDLATLVGSDLAGSITSACSALINVKPSIPVDAPYLGNMYDALYFLTLSMLPYSYQSLSKSFAADVDPRSLIQSWSRVDAAYHACRDAYPQVVYCYTCYSS